MIKTYTELSRLITFEDRYRYLRIGGSVGKSTFGYDRYINQMLYSSYRWRRVRDQVIIRDEACDLGIKERDISNRIYIHHMNPLNIEDFTQENPDIFDPEYLICTSNRTHQAIHYGDESLLPQLPIVRRPGDTSPWR